MSECWKSAVGYEGFYDVSSEGRIRSLRFSNGTTKSRPRPSPKLMSIRPNSDGYLIVDLSKSGVCLTQHVHILVLRAFVGERPSGLQGAHVDGNPANAKVGNLIWATQSENEAHKKIHGTSLLGRKRPCRSNHVTKAV
jgi:hypothetical protein